MENNVDYSKIPINALTRSRQILSESLNIPRIILNDEGVPKDWRGLWYYIGGRDGFVSTSDPDPTGKVLSLWQTSKEISGTFNVESLLKYLQQLERWDVYDDINEVLKEDVQFYANNHNALQKEPVCIEEDASALTLNDEYYDAYVLYHDKNAEHGLNVIRELESRQLKCCDYDRDLLTSEFSHQAITTLISKRCAKLVILVTEAFLNSSLCKYIFTYTQALGIERGTKKLVPLRFDDSELPDQLCFYKMIDFTKEDIFNNRWERVTQSIKIKPTTKEPPARKVVSNTMINNNVVQKDMKHIRTFASNTAISSNYSESPTRNLPEPTQDVAGAVQQNSATISNEIYSNYDMNSLPSLPSVPISSASSASIELKEENTKKMKSKRKKEKKSIIKKLKEMVQSKAQVL